MPAGFLWKEEGTTLTYLSEGRDVRSMTHKIDGVKKKKKKRKEGTGGRREREARGN